MPMSERAESDPVSAILASAGSDDALFRHAVMSARDGGVIATVARGSSGSPLTLANPTFERMTGYRRDEIPDRDCRFLQGDDTGQPGIRTVREATARGMVAW